MKKKSNGTKDQLFNLIASLTKAEKAFFTKFSTLHVKDKKSHSIELFEAIEKMADYDETTLLKKLKSDNLSKNISFHKSYLHNLILKAMNSMYAQTSAENEFMEEIKSFRFLHSKNLKTQAKKSLKRAKSITFENQLTTGLLEVQFYERRNIIEDFNNNMISEVSKVNEEMISTLEGLQKEIKMSVYYYNTFPLMSQTGVARNKDLLKQIERVRVAVDQLAKSKGPDTFLYLLWYNTFYETYYLLYNRFEKSINFSLDIIKLYENNMVIRKNRIIGYIYVLNNFLNAAIRLKYLDDFKLYIKKLEALLILFPNSEMRILERLYHFKLLFALETGQNRKAIAKQTETWIDENKNSLMKSKLIILYYDLSHIYFNSEDYKKALYFNNLILNDFKEIIYFDFISESKLFHLIIQYELGNYEYLRYAIVAFNRNLLTEKASYKSERTVVRFLKKLINEYSYSMKTKLLMDLKSELIQLKKDKFESFFISELRLFSWIEKYISSEVEKK